MSSPNQIFTSEQLFKPSAPISISRPNSSHQQPTLNGMSVSQSPETADSVGSFNEANFYGSYDLNKHIESEIARKKASKML